jgi:hypothetical protein
MAVVLGKTSLTLLRSDITTQRVDATVLETVAETVRRRAGAFGESRFVLFSARDLGVYEPALDRL